MSRVIRQVTYDSRAINFRGVVMFHGVGKYVTDFLRKFKGEGWKVTPMRPDDIAEAEPALAVVGDIAYDVRPSMLAPRLPLNRATEPQTTKQQLIAAIDALPDEAFGWIVSQCLSGIWPDGLGGFRPESRAAIENVRKAAKEYYAAAEKASGGTAGQE